jgi:hypothetical protein
VFLGKLSKVRHQRVDGIFHVEVSDRYPNGIGFSQQSLLLLLPADSVLVGISKGQMCSNLPLTCSLYRLLPVEGR